MTHICLCVYPDMKPLSEIEEYFKMASKYGADRTFASMFSAEGTNEEITKCFTDFCTLAHKYNLKVSLDVNPEFLARFDCYPDDCKYIHDIGCDVMRLDGDYSLEDDLKIIANPYGIGVEFNASMPSRQIKELIARGVKPEQILTSHNFYPQPKTGMKWQAYLDINKELRGLGCRVGASVASHNPITHGVWNPIAGLPSVEMTRYYPMDLQARLLIAGGATDIFIGNAYATEEEMKALYDATRGLDANDPYIQEQVAKCLPGRKVEDLEVRRMRVKLDPAITDLEKEILFKYVPHYDRGDTSEWMMRSTWSRTTYSKGAGVPARPIGKPSFEVGDVMIVNNNYQHYAGEVQICMIPFEDDKIRNVVGHISPEEMKQVELLKSEQIWQFLEEK